MILTILAIQATELPDFNKPDGPPEMPSAIRGAWDLSEAACRNEYSDSRMHIGIDWIGFYESSGRLQIVAPAGHPNTQNSMVFRFVMAGEGSTWNSEFVFGWNGSKPNRLASIEPKNAKNLLEGRRVDWFVRCNK